jgi:hypothetical protein
MPNLKLRFFFFSSITILLLLSGCDSNNSKTDTDKTLITSCDQQQKMGALTLTAAEQTQVCQIMVTQLQRQPPVYLLRDLLRLVYLVRQTAAPEPVDTIAMQSMKIVQLRQQQKNDEAIQNTFDVIWKIYQSTQTQVNFAALDGMLDKNSHANLMSDDQLEQMSIEMWQKKLVTE